MNPYKVQTIKITASAACEYVGRIIRDTNWGNVSCADLTYKILAAIGFKELPPVNK